MDTNTLPRYDMSDISTGCCPRFNPDGWDGRRLHFRGKTFVRATTRSVLHVPVDMGRVFARVNRRLEEAEAVDPDDFVVLSRELSPWQAEHLFATKKAIPGEEMTTLSGDFITEVFEGSYNEAREWAKDLVGLARAHGFEPKSVYFFYTTCPKCAKAYGKNYVVGFVQI